MHAVAVATLTAVVATWVSAAATLALLTAIELITPRGAPLPITRRLQGLVFWVPWVAAGAALTAAFHAIWERLGLHPIGTVDLNALVSWAGPAAPLVAAILAAMIADLAFYWFHRAQHASPWLWRFHAVHHSIRDMSAVNSYHHVSEGLVRLVLTGIPLTLLGIHAQGAVIVGALFGMQVIAIHSPSRVHAGPLRRVLVDNRFHRIHHSRNPAHYDRNFSANFAFWDQLFGTAYFPAAEEWPDVGLADFPEPSSLGEWLCLPFQRPQFDIEHPSESGATA